MRILALHACSHALPEDTRGWRTQTGSQTRNAQRTTGCWNCDYFDDVDALRSFGSANTGNAAAKHRTCGIILATYFPYVRSPLPPAESLAELLASFFHHWAAAHDYRSAVVTIRRGLPLTKAEKGWCERKGEAI